VKALAGALGGALLLSAPVAHGRATVVIVNADAPDAGFNDPTPVSPVGNNPGTTLGAQRLAVFQAAAEIWGSTLESAAPITVLSHFEPLACDPTGAVLGSAGPTNIFASDDPTLPPGVSGSVFPKPHTWYVSALGASFAGTPLVPGTGTDPANYDILARFNSTLDDPGASCNGLQWYYGLDDNHGNLIDLLTVVLHEFGHGLGFISLTDPTTGQYPQDEPDIWSYYLYDETSGRRWIDMDDAGTRAASAISEGLFWDGPSVKAAVPVTLDVSPFRVNSATSTPSVVKAYSQITTAQFSGAIPTSSPITADLDIGSTRWGCTGGGKLAPLDGKIAILNRGGPSADAGCTFVEKARNAQDAGALGLVIANNTEGPPPLIMPSGTAPDITIPVLFVTQTEGLALQAAVDAGTVNGSIVSDPANGFLGGDQAGRGMNYAPPVFESGSSVSHWDVSAFPNLLMEPIINADLTHSLDLTVPLLHDIGWALSDGGTSFPDGGTGSPDAGTGLPEAGGGGGGSSSGCTSALGPPAAWLALLTLLAFVRRRRAV